MLHVKSELSARRIRQSASFPKPKFHKNVLRRTRSAQRDGGGFGTQTAAVAAGGNTGSASNSTEEYDGSSWSSGGNLNESFNESKAMGTETAGLRFGGET